jgi:dipeptidyl aminopeptidase/acylaminoacyl peptidase
MSQMTGEILQFTSGGHTIHIDAFEPTTSAHTNPAIVLLHGAGGNIGFWLERFAAPITSMGVAVYGIRYFERTGTERATYEMITDGKHVPLWLETVVDGLRFLAKRPGVNQARMAMLGVSLGAYLSLGMAARPPAGTPAIRCIVEISGGLAPGYAESVNSSFPPTLILHGDADTVVPAAEAHALAARLTAVGVPHTLKLLPGEGHWFSPAGQMQLLFAAAPFLGQYLRS